MIWRRHIDILMLGKCNPLSQPREHDAKIQITHAEHYKESDNLFLNKSFNTMHIDNQSILTGWSFDRKCKVQLSDENKILMDKTILERYRNKSVAFSWISSIFADIRFILTHSSATLIYRRTTTLYRENFAPVFFFALFALWPEGVFKTGLIELFIKVYIRKL